MDDANVATKNSHNATPFGTETGTRRKIFGKLGTNTGGSDPPVYSQIYNTIDINTCRSGKREREGEKEEKIEGNERGKIEEYVPEQRE